MATVNATFTLTGWNGPQLMNRVATIMTSYGKAMDQQLKEEIKLVQFPWPGITYRRNGTIEGSPRDIVDTGRFLASQRRTRPNATTLQFTWGGSAGVDYAGIILKGRPDTAAYPGRNWIERALKKKPLDKFFAQEWNRQTTRFEDIDFTTP
jgi:hypothetical protein